MPRRRKSRVQTNSDASVDIQVQVTEAHRIVTTTTASILSGADVQSAAKQESLVVPKSGFLDLLRSVGAKGEATYSGEVFTLQMLSNYLKEYIKLQQLWDASDPMTICCKNDPLSKVLGVSQFSLMEVRDLLAKTSYPVEKGTAAMGYSDPLAIRDAGFLLGPRCVSEEMIPSQPSLLHGGHSSKRGKRKRQNTSSSASSETKRERQSSISIFYSDTEGSSASYPYLVQFHVEESDMEDVLSVQSKTTAVVSDSSDDFWFLEEVETLEMVELQSANEDPPFEEEYEVESEASTGAGEVEYTEDSTEEGSDIQIYQDVDKEFWADSESSDWETDSTDRELSDSDKWSCNHCRFRNIATHRNCDRCWTLRKGWLAERKTTPTPEASAEVSEQFKSGTRMCEEKLYSSSDNEAAKCYYQSKQREIDPSSTRSQQILALQSPKDIVDLTIPSADPHEHLLLDKPAYSAAGASNLCHTWTSAADTPIMTASVQDNDFEGGLLLPTSSQDSGLYLCSPQESLEDSFEIPSSMPVTLAESAIVNVSQSLCLSQASISGTSGTDHAMTEKAMNESMLLHRKDSGLGSFTVTTPEEGACPSSVETLPNRTGHSPYKKRRRRKSQTISVPPGPAEGSSATSMCSICLNNPKDASLIHGRTGHQMCCYRCAKRLYRRRRPCPVCRRRIQKVIRNYFV